MLRIISICALLSFRSIFAFETHYADSLYSTLPENPGERAEFILDNFYSVFNKSHKDGIEWAEWGLEFSIEASSDQLEGRSHLCLGTAWYLSGDYEKCFDHYQQALEIFEATKDEKYIGRTNNELSVYYRKQKQYEKGLECLDISYESCMSCKDMECVETSLNNRGVIYEMMGNFQLAVVFYQKAQVIAEENGNEIGLSYIYNNLAEVYRLKQNYDSADWYIDQSIILREKLNDKQGIAINWINRGELYAEWKKYDRSIEALEKGMVLANEVQYWDLIKHGHLQLSRAYKGMGDIERSLFHLERSYILKDSLLNEDKIRALSDMEVKYETEKIEKGLLEEKQLRTEAELESANRTKWIYGISGGSLSLVFLILFLYQRRLKRIQREKDKAILEEREKGLVAVIDATEEERQRIAKDLHDGVGQQMSGIRLAWENLSVELKSKAPDELKQLEKLGQHLDEAAQDIRNISHQMMPKVLDEFGLVPALEEMLNKSFDLSSVECVFEHYNISERFTRRIEISLYRICQELINNIIKHSGATKVSVQLFKNKEQLILIVEDNGKGMTDNVSEGHGLLNIKSRLNTIQGKVNYEASEMAGTTATIRITIGQAENQ